MTKRKRERPLELRSSRRDIGTKTVKDVSREIAKRYASPHNPDGGAVSLTEVQERQASGEAYAAMVEAERAERMKPETMDIEHPPTIVGVSRAETMKGYSTVTVPYAQKCKANKHIIPPNAKVFTDGFRKFCPYCGSELQAR